VIPLTDVKNERAHSAKFELLDWAVQRFHPSDFRSHSYSPANPLLPTRSLAILREGRKDSKGQRRSSLCLFPAQVQYPVSTRSTLSKLRSILAQVVLGRRFADCLRSSAFSAFKRNCCRLHGVASRFTRLRDDSYSTCPRPAAASSVLGTRLRWQQNRGAPTWWPVENQDPNFCYSLAQMFSNGIGNAADQVGQEAMSILVNFTRSYVTIRVRWSPPSNGPQPPS
jgi:hypothetical protein